jgi:hypothetical protein
LLLNLYDYYKMQDYGDLMNDDERLYTTLKKVFDE